MHVYIYCEYRRANPSRGSIAGRQHRSRRANLTSKVNSSDYGAVTEAKCCNNARPFARFAIRQYLETRTSRLWELLMAESGEEVKCRGRKGRAISILLRQLGKIASHVCPQPTRPLNLSLATFNEMRGGEKEVKDSEDALIIAS